MTCKQLGGTCEKTFSAETFEEIAELSKRHGMEMFERKDKAHLSAMESMKKLMADPKKMQEWFLAKEQEFERLPED